MVVLTSPAAGTHRRYRLRMADTSVRDIIARLRGIDEELPRNDGARVFNHMYLTVTEAVAAALDGAHVFRDPEFMEQLDVTFAGFWLEAYDAREAAVPRPGCRCSSVGTTARCCRSSSPSPA